MGFHAFSGDISPEMNVITPLEFELTYYDVEVQHVSHNAMRSPSTILCDSVDSLRIIGPPQCLVSVGVVSLASKF